MTYVGKFEDQIKKFNKMYDLKEPADPKARLANFLDIFQEEVEEWKDIDAKLDQGDDSWKVDMADWLCDMIVYCASEAERYKIPIGKTLNIIMDSNFSKLDEQGNPIYDKRNKIIKGPNYKKPEPTIAKMLETGEYDGELI